MATESVSTETKAPPDECYECGGRREFDGTPFHMPECSQDGEYVDPPQELSPHVERAIASEGGQGG